jgi:hypothetical protein
MTRSRWLAIIAVLASMVPMSPASAVSQQKENMKGTGLCSDFTVIEFRRYTVREGERENFAKYFEAYFPEAMQQLGAIAAGQFLERDNPLHFTWIRGLMNGLMTDSDNVLLLHSVEPECGIAVLPSVDVVKEASGAKGVVVAQIFPIKAGGLKEFMDAAGERFAGYRSAGMRETGLFVTLDAANNFPQLPVRTDGPFVVWFGIAKNNAVLDQQFRGQAEKAAKSLETEKLLRGAPELVILDPTSRSRMRWLEEWR